MFNLASIGFYCLFGIFVFYQQLHAKNFRGGSPMFGLILSLSSLLGTVVGFIYLGYYGWNISWIGAIAALIGGILAAFAGVMLERKVGMFAISMLGFFAWPACAYFMFATLK